MELYLLWIFCSIYRVVIMVFLFLIFLFSSLFIGIFLEILIRIFFKDFVWLFVNLNGSDVRKFFVKILFFNILCVFNFDFFSLFFFNGNVIESILLKVSFFFVIFMFFLFLGKCIFEMEFCMERRFFFRNFFIGFLSIVFIFFFNVESKLCICFEVIFFVLW